MRTSARLMFAATVGLAGMVGLAARPILAQVDAKVQKAATPANGNATRPTAPPAVGPAVIGSIDMERVIQEYEKYKESSDKFKSAALKKQTELQTMLQEAKNVAEQRDRYKPGTPDFSKYNDKLTELQVKLNAEKEKISQNFQMEESSAVADIYNDIRKMTEAVAKNKNMTFVVQVGRNEPLTGENPNDVMAALSRNIVYYNPASDVTNDVVYALNYYYKKSKEANGTPQPAAPKAAAQPAAQPAASQAPAAGN